MPGFAPPPAFTDAPPGFAAPTPFGASPVTQPLQSFGAPQTGEGLLDSLLAKIVQPPAAAPQRGQGYAGEQAYQGALAAPLSGAKSAAKRAGRIQKPATPAGSEGTRQGKTLYHMPVLNYKITQNYNGDLDLGTVHVPFYSPITGKVVSVGLFDGWGYTLRVQMADGSILLFGHMTETSMKVGDYVTPGLQLGITGGDNGDWRDGISTGAHLCLVRTFANGSRDQNILNWLLYDLPGYYPGATKQPDPNPPEEPDQKHPSDEPNDASQQQPEDPFFNRSGSVNYLNEMLGTSGGVMDPVAAYLNQATGTSLTPFMDPIYANLSAFGAFGSPNKGSHKGQDQGDQKGT